ncbi:uncharacterized protein LOC124139308 isoform X1 [Haliotis rufescens]|uniref:uncharacterized protein LOC124139308 isoform X1 n=1 Tax=Haliotis rufescens TaxID=6454 RepID=UPI00201F6716|nr:uncharacterized protein LOC124139308 isoform X1 [Haliotis rufescens]
MSNRESDSSSPDMNSDSPRGHKGRQQRPELQREYSDLTKQKHEEVVMKLLEDFDIEDTKDKYRCSRGEITYVPKRRGLADNQFRAEMRRLMGSEVIHLNDRKWNERFQRRLQEEYEKRLDRKEDELAEAEAVRIRKLKLEGLVPMSAENGADEYGHVTGGSGKRSKEKRKRGHKSRKKRSPSPSPRGTRCRSAPPARPVTWYKPSEDIPTQVELMNKRRSRKHSMRSRDRSKSRDASSGNNESSPREDRSTSPVGSEGSATSRQKRPREIKDLYQEETVDGLYVMAERLVYIDPHPKQKGKKDVTITVAY